MSLNNNPPQGNTEPDTQPAASAQPLPLRRRLRWWIPAIIVILAVANIARVRSTPEADTMYRNMQTFFTIAGTAVLLAIWWLFFTKLRWRTRLTWFAVVVVCLFGLNQLVRIDGSLSGSGRPRIVWRWTPRKTGEVAETRTPAPSRTGGETNAPADYPGYLGGNRSGVVTGARLDADWTARPPVEVWRRPIGLGWSAFAVAGSQAITQEQRGENELIVGYDLATGQPAWFHTNVVRFSEPMGGDGPRATPTIDRGRVYALGATGILDCLDAATGRLIWSHDTLKEEGLPNTYFGKCSSPLIAGDLVVVTGGMAKKATLLAYQRDDGKLKWSAGNDEASFSSPTLATLGGRAQIVSVNAASVTGHDLADGHILWQYDWGNNKWPKCAQPIVLGGDRILITASFNAGCALLQLKPAADGGFSVEEVWKNRNLKSEFSNCVAREGFAYGLDDGILACIDLATGERKWKDGHYGHGQVALVDGLLLVQTEAGPVALVEASPSGYREVTRLNALNAKTWNTPALAGNLLLVRNDSEAVCYKLPLLVTPAAQ